MSACPTCGGAGLRGVTHICSFGGQVAMSNKPMQEGWRCPVCGLGNAPWIPYCTHCRDNARRAAVSGSGE